MVTYAVRSLQVCGVWASRGLLERAVPRVSHQPSGAPANYLPEVPAKRASLQSSYNLCSLKIEKHFALCGLSRETGQRGASAEVLSKHSSSAAKHSRAFLRQHGTCSLKIEKCANDN